MNNSEGIVTAPAKADYAGIAAQINHLRVEAIKGLPKMLDVLETALPTPSEALAKLREFTGGRI